MPMIFADHIGHRGQLLAALGAGLQHLRRELEPVHHRLGQTGGDGTLQVAGVVDLQGLHVGAQQGGQLSQGGVLHCRGRLGHQGRSSLGLQADGLQGFGDRVGGHGLYCRRYCMSPQITHC
jgi:hypothetical protein